MLDLEFQRTYLHSHDFIMCDANITINEYINVSKEIISLYTQKRSCISEK